MTFMDLPLWCAPLGAAAMYVMLRYVPLMVERYGSPSSAGHMMGLYLAAVAPWAAGLTLVAGVMGALKRWMDRPPRARATSSPRAAAPATAVAGQAPSCPRCAGTMLERVARKGASAGQAFWGCADYPKCKGTVPIA